MHHDVEKDAVADNRHNDRDERRVHDLLSALFCFIHRTDPLLSAEIQHKAPREQD